MLVLSILGKGENHGYGIVKTIKEQSSDCFEFKEGTIYPLLHRLQKEGYIKGRWSKSEAGRRRRSYAITRSGKTLLGQHKKEWRLFSSAVSSVLGETHA